MNDRDVPSDEPTRLRQVVQQLFAGQSGQTVWHRPGSSAKLLAGAEAQDDCAVFELTGDCCLVAGSDYVRGPHFTLYRAGMLSEYDLGYFLVAANLSDIAAMGAEPIAVLTVVRYPQDMPNPTFELLMQGIADACTANGTLNVGGDIGTAERLILSGTALGMCAPGSALMRTGASPGDLLCLTGDVGVAGAAVMYYGEAADARATLNDTAIDQMLTAWRKPNPQLRAGSVLSRRGLATACMDTSDGLRATVETLSSASDVGFVISAAKVNLATAVLEVASALSLDPLTLAFSASVDFQLAFTIHPDSLLSCQRCFEEMDLELCVIGEATQDRALRLRTADGRLVDIPGVPWRHQGASFRTQLRGDRAE